MWNVKTNVSSSSTYKIYLWQRVPDNKLGTFDVCLYSGTICLNITDNWSFLNIDKGVHLSQPKTKKIINTKI